MKAYWEIIKAHIKLKLIWREDLLLTLIAMIMKIIFASLLWGAIFKTNNTLTGFTFNSMLAYYLINSFLVKIDKSDQISWTVSEGIRNGTFSKYMTLPINVDNYFLSIATGMMLPHLIFGLAMTWVLFVLLHISEAITLSIDLIVCALIMAGLGLLFMAQLNYFLGLLAFKFEDVSTFLMLKKNLISLINGSLIPLAIFPEAFTNILSLLPFYYVSYLPAMLLLGKRKSEALPGIFIMIIWNVFMRIISTLTYKKYRIEYDGVGA